jgi:hypothetical protein
MSESEVPNAKAGVVYILTNPEMETLIKIGKCSTGRLLERIREINRHEAVPIPFQVFYAAQVADKDFVERQMHEIFGDRRPNSRREFFRVDPVRARAALRMVALEDLTVGSGTSDEPESEEALQREIQRKPPLNMRAIGIPEDAMLVHVDDPTITCVVRGPREVEFDGQRMSLSAAARIVAEKAGKLVASGAYQGGQYWLYEGETLVEIRRRVEATATGESTSEGT